MKTITIFLALVNSIVSVIFLAITLSPENAGGDIPYWLSAKVIAGSFVAGAGFLTWLDCLQPIPLKLMAVCGLLLTMLGVASTTWVVQLGIIRGDMLSALTVYGCSVTAQGIASLFSLESRPNPVHL